MATETIAGKRGLTIDFASHSPIAWGIAGPGVIDGDLLDPVGPKASE